MSPDPPVGLPPVVQGIHVRIPPPEAFALFTERMGEWWPLRTRSIAAADEAGRRAVDVTLEPIVGGRVYEVMDDGSTASWGVVVAWEPPHRLVLAWNPTRTRTLFTEVEVQFAATGDGGTDVRLEHRGWERLGSLAPRSRANYASGWTEVLAGFAASSNASGSSTSGSSPSRSAGPR